MWLDSAICVKWLICVHVWQAIWVKSGGFAGFNVGQTKCVLFDQKVSYKSFVCTVVYEKKVPLKLIFCVYGEPLGPKYLIVTCVLYALHVV